MQRRKMLAALGSVAVGGATAVSTGAFTTVSANRSVSVEITGDSQALLGLDKNSAGSNNEYATISDGEVSIELDNGDDGGGAGLNENAETDIFDIFGVENQTTQPVFVYVPPESVSRAVRPDADDDGDREFAQQGTDTEIYVDPQATSRPNAENSTSGRGGISFTGIYGTYDPSTGFAGTDTYDAADLTLGVGESLNFGLFVRTQSPPDELDVSMEIAAEEDVAADI